MAKLTQETVRELLHYDPESGVFTWRIRNSCWFKTERDCQAWNTRYSGNRAGRAHTLPKTGYQYRGMRLLGRDYKEHRIAWIYMTGKPLPEEIDHKNQDGTDNRWRNLRESTRMENGKNMSMPRTNTSGVSGVTWNKQAGKWQAGCRYNGKRNHLGLFNDSSEAAQVVAAFRASHGFTSEHGVEVAKYHSRKTQAPAS